MQWNLIRAFFLIWYTPCKYVDPLQGIDRVTKVRKMEKKKKKETDFQGLKVRDVFLNSSKS